MIILINSYQEIEMRDFGDVGSSFLAANDVR